MLENQKEASGPTLIKATEVFRSEWWLVATIIKPPSETGLNDIAVSTLATPKSECDLWFPEASVVMRQTAELEELADAVPKT